MLVRLLADKSGFWDIKCTSLLHLFLALSATRDRSLLGDSVPEREGSYLK
jgi:hypothetical protein